MAVRVQTADFDATTEIARLTKGRKDVGAIVTFIGTVRAADDGDPKMIAMTLEHYPEMTEIELSNIEAVAQRRWPLRGLTIIHRFGRLAPGENIVLVVTASEHRLAAFEAAEFVMDYLKTDAPFWKLEHFADGTARWVEARKNDAAAQNRWIGKRESDVASVQR